MRRALRVDPTPAFDPDLPFRLCEFCGLLGLSMSWVTPSRRDSQGVAMARFQPSVERFSKAVEAVYDAALNPGGWHTALQRIGELIDSPCVCLSVTDYAQQSVALCVNYGYEPEYLKVYFE